MSARLRGRCLIATRKLRDPNFFKSVVLIVEHGEEGSMGLIINRPSSVTIAHALSGHFELPETDDLVYVGGPVEPSALFILHNASQYGRSETPVVPGVYVGSNADIFEEVVRGSVEGNPETRFRIYSGCAGWASGQLDGELSRGDWHQLAARVDLIFAEDPYIVWDKMIEEVRETNSIVPPAPNNPEWN